MDRKEEYRQKPKRVVLSRCSGCGLMTKKPHLTPLACQRAIRAARLLGTGKVVVKK